MGIEIYVDPNIIIRFDGCCRFYLSFCAIHVIYDNMRVYDWTTKLIKILLP